MKIGFICDKHSNRDTLAEGLGLKLSRDIGLKAEIYGASLNPDKEMNPYVLELLKEKGVSISNPKPKSLEDIPYEELDVIIMICDKVEEVCPFIMSHIRRETWIIEEPEDTSLEKLRYTMSKLEQQIKALFKYDKKP